MIAAVTSSDDRRGERWGRELRSSSPGRPSVRKRRTHLYAVARLIPSCSGNGGRRPTVDDHPFDQELPTEDGKTRT